MKQIYRSPYEAYTFLSEKDSDLRCDFEILSDKIASLTGLLASKIQDQELRKELIQVETLIYHLNPALRTKNKITKQEMEWLRERMEDKQIGNRGFVLPAGTENACLAHVLRAMCKEMVRMCYRVMERGIAVEEITLDVANLLSGYFFYLALWLNREAGVEEIPFVSRNYAGMVSAENDSKRSE